MSKKRKKILRRQINERLDELDRIGESRGDAKRELKQKGAYKFGDSPAGIFSISTKENYRQILVEFSDFCVNQKNEQTRADLDDLLSKYAQEYLEMRKTDGFSVSTISRDRSALNKVILGDKIKIDLKTRSIHDIKRSRTDKNSNNKHFKEENNKDLVNFARATGGRREDLSKLTSSDFFKENGRLFVRFEQSKGGKSRIAPVREEFSSQIEKRLKMTEKGALVFARIHKHADIHSYRREYAQNLYADVINDKETKNHLLKFYPARVEKVKGDTYTTKGQDNVFQGKRDDIYIITQALGHNRLDVAVNHYLR